MRHYNEAYNLAYAQQLKNKDIPEGGSKAVILMEPDDSDAFLPDREHVPGQSVCGQTGLRFCKQGPWEGFASPWNELTSPQVDKEEL